LLSDIFMPETSGLKLLDEVHSLYPELPVILMTAYAKTDIAIDAIRKGAFDFIEKPFNMELLLHSVKRAIRYGTLLKTEAQNKAICHEALLKATKAENEIKKLNAELEQKIVERTAELETSNKLLLSEIEEHKASENAVRLAAEEAQHRAMELANTCTKLKQTQSQLIQQEKMASIGQFAAGIAHEIKNPLGIIVQCIYFLKDSLSDGLLTDVSERAIKAALRADKIVKDLLSFARQSPPALQKMDIGSIIEETLRLVEYQLNLKNIRVIRRFEEGSLITLIDSNQMKQVFINLLINAADAMSQGGAIEIDAGMDVTPVGKPAVRISFSDNGCGIEPENLNKIFDPFFTTKRDSGGTGLGLSISLGIVEDHSGTITIESRVGEGTRVTVTLPAPEQ
jgi:signal transduction histidine kinase